MGLSPLKLGGLVASFLATSGSLASSHAIADRRREDCFAPWQPSTLLFVVAHASIIRVSSLFLEMSNGTQMLQNAVLIVSIGLDNRCCFPNHAGRLM